MQQNLVEETDDLAGNVLAAGLLVVHDTGGGGQDNVTELTRRKELDNPLLHVAELDVVAGRDDTGLVEAAVKLDNNLAVAVVIDLLELANVTWSRTLVCCKKINSKTSLSSPKPCKFLSIDLPDT
jgi:hypothetical protein